MKSVLSAAGFVGLWFRFVLTRLPPGYSHKVWFVRTIIDTSQKKKKKWSNWNGIFSKTEGGDTCCSSYIKLPLHVMIHYIAGNNPVWCTNLHWFNFIGP